MSNDQVLDFDIEREKLELERRKIELEQEKIKIERSKTRWTAVSIIIPVVIAAATFAFSAWNQTQQAKIQAEMQAQQAKSQFELKAAEILMNTQTPLEAQTKAKALEKLFPDSVPKNFSESFNPAVYSANPKATKNEGQLGRGWLKVFYLDEPLWWEEQLNWQEVLEQTEMPMPQSDPLRQELVLAYERALLAEKRALLEERTRLEKEKANIVKGVQEISYTPPKTYYIPPKHISYTSTDEDIPQRKPTAFKRIAKLLIGIKRLSL